MFIGKIPSLYMRKKKRQIEFQSSDSGHFMVILIGDRQFYHEK